MPISVFISASVRLFREGLATTVGSRPQLRVDGMAGSHRDTLTSIRDRRPDIVIVDVTLDDVLCLICAIKAESSEIYVLAIAVSEDVRTILNYAEAGADGFLTANSSTVHPAERDCENALVNRQV